LPSPPVTASALQPPCRGPALLPPCRGPALLPPLSRPCPAAAHCLGPDLNHQLRPCPTPAPAEPSHTAEPRCPSTCTASAATTATAATAAITATTAMASPTVLTFDAEGRAVDFDVWVDDLHLFLQYDSRDGVSLFNHTSGVSTAPAATADSTVCSQWTTRDAVARLAIRSHLPPAERAHFGQYKAAKALYDAVVARYSSPATAALSRLMLSYLFPELAAFATAADLITHLRTSDARYRDALPTEDHFLSLCPTELTIDLLEERLAEAEKSILAVEAASTPSGRRRNSKGKGSKGGGGDGGGGGGGVEEAEGVAVEVGVVPGVGASVATAEVVEEAAAVVEAAAAVVLVEVQPHSVEALVVASASSSRVPVRPRRPSSFVSGKLGVGGLGVLVPGGGEGRHGGRDPQPHRHGHLGAGQTPTRGEHHEEPVCGADYDETYSPVSSYVTLRIFLSIVAVFDLNLMQLDMKNAFLQSKLDRVLYMHQLDYFDDGTGRVCKLLKSLYWLKQSLLLWYRALDGVLLGADCKKSQVDEALYFKAGDDGVTCWVLVYVDDLLAASSSPTMLKELKELLEAAFELREISPVVKYLGLEIVRDRLPRKLWLHQQGYADKLRRRFIDKEQGGRLPPDIAFACSKLGSGLTVRSDQHWHEVDRCLAYLADTRDTSLEFGGGPESLELIGYVDADDAGDKQDRTSTGGYVFVYGGSAVSWSSSCIKCATLSSTESEYVAATNAGKEGR
ncbi:unnamed protein product, partial [Closterium sp. NIES-54]